MDIIHSVIIAIINISKVDLKSHNGNIIDFFWKTGAIEGTIRLRAMLAIWLTIVIWMLISSS